MRWHLRVGVWALSLLFSLGLAHSEPRVPVIDVTDLYHPHQDVGDNFDIVTAYALPEIDLRAVVLDCTEAFRKPVADDPDMYGRPPRSSLRAQEWRKERPRVWARFRSLGARSSQGVQLGRADS